MPDDPRAHLPLKPVDLQLLLVLNGGECHGYGLTQALEQRTEGLMKLDPGNLYRVIKRLLAAGLVAESARRSAPDLAGERRRHYRLTGLGGQVLAAELTRLDALVRSAEARALVGRRAT
jgi:DNA-binding PadR family transcriptional regulator